MLFAIVSFEATNDQQELLINNHSLSHCRIRTNSNKKLHLCETFSKSMKHKKAAAYGTHCFPNRGRKGYQIDEAWEGGRPRRDSSRTDQARSEGGSKTQNGDFPCKIALRLKKVCYKVSLCENRQRQSCKAFIGLSIRGENFLYVKIWRILTHPLAKRRFLMYFRS